jgi:hypothetical protein
MPGEPPINSIARAIVEVRSPMFAPSDSRTSVRGAGMSMVGSMGEVPRTAMQRYGIVA